MKEGANIASVGDPVSVNDRSACDLTQSTLGGFRVLVCGGRTYSDRAKVYQTLNDIHDVTPISCIIHGGATGADAHAAKWALLTCVKQSAFEADWKTHGKSAGPIRNQRMLDEGKPHLVVAFPGKNGTANMVERAKAARVEVREVS